MSSFRSLCVAFTFLVASPLLSATLTESVAAAKNLQLADEVSPVSGLTITVGHMTFKLASGSASRVLAGGEPVGIFFKGTGSLEYEAAEPTELPVVKFNVHAETHLNNSGDARRAVLAGSFAELLYVKASGALPELSGTGVASLSEAFAAHRTLYARARLSSPAHDLTLQKFGAPAALFAYAEVGGGSDNLAYMYDGVDALEESLVLLRPFAYPQEDKRMSDRLFPLVLSSQPIGHDRKVTVKPFVALTDLNYSLVADGDNAKLEVTETLFRTNAAQNAVRFEMEDELFVKLSRPMRTFNVRSVTDAAGRALPFDHSYTSLIVGLDGVQGQVFKLKFVIDGDFLVRKGGDNAWQLGSWSWFPQITTGRQAFTVHSVVRVKKPFFPLTPGTTIKRGEEGDYNVVESMIEKPVRYTVVQAGKYTTVEDTINGVVIRVASYGLPSPRASKQLINLAGGIIDYYEYFLGPFPFREFNIVQVNDYGSGQAPPGTMFITNEAFDSLIEARAQYFSEGINERFAHEIAHQYWGHVVAWGSDEEQWLSESFAEYSAGLALKKLKGDAVYNRMVNGWRSRAKQASGVAPIPYANRIGGDPRAAFTYRIGLLYNKGPYLLYTLHKQIGDTQFLTFMKSYQKSFQWKFGTTNDVAGLLQFMTKTDYKPFFDQYFWGTAMPD